jgi:hypothetical protein
LLGKVDKPMSENLKFLEMGCLWIWKRHCGLPVGALITMKIAQNGWKNEEDMRFGSFCNKYLVCLKLKILGLSLVAFGAQRMIVKFKLVHFFFFKDHSKWTKKKIYGLPKSVRV